MENQIRRCNFCRKLWQTHECNEKLFKCPNCKSTTKDHEIICGNNVYSSHRFNPNEYSNILARRTWHSTFGEDISYKSKK